MTALEILRRSFRELKVPDRLPRWATSSSGIYLLVSNETVQYVGRSGDVVRRVHAHRLYRLRRAIEAFDSALWCPIPMACSIYYEGALVRALLPEFNRCVPSYSEYDNEILEGFGLDPHPDPIANHIDCVNAYRTRNAAQKAERARVHREWCAQHPEEFIQ